MGANSTCPGSINGLIKKGLTYYNAAFLWSTAQWLLFNNDKFHFLRPLLVKNRDAVALMMMMTAERWQEGGDKKVKYNKLACVLY